MRTAAHALERLSLLLLVGGAVFEFVTGILNIQTRYVFPGSFYTLHFYGAWVFIAALRGPRRPEVPDGWCRALRSRGLRASCAPAPRHTRPEPPDATAWSSPAPAAPTMSRRGALALVAAPVRLPAGS